jgi:hypothetical protein
MANVDVTLTAALKYYNGNAATSVGVKAIRESDPTLAGEMNTSDIIEAVSNDSTGVVSLTLKGTDKVSVVYKVVLPDTRYFYLTLPKNAKTCRLGVVPVSPSPAVGVKDISSQVDPAFVGQDLASHASNVTPTCSVHTITGTTAITSMVATEYPVGKPLTLIFASTPTFTDGNNLKIAGNLVATADDTITLVSDGTNFFEIGRAVN